VSYELMMILFGLGVGLLVGATGVGGGSIMTPLLVVVAGVPPVSAIGTDLFYAAVTKTVGGASHFRKNTVDLRLSMQLAVGSVPAALAAVFLLSFVEDRIGFAIDTPLIVTVAIAIAICGVAMLWQTLFPPPVRPDRAPRHQWIAAIVSGALVGFVLGLTSAGSGAVLALLLIAVFQLAPHRVVGTDVFHAALLLWAASIGNIILGNVDFLLAGLLLLGSIPGVLIGARVSVWLPALALRCALAGVLLAAAGSLAVKAGLPLPPVGLVVWFAIVALGVVVMYRRVRTTHPELPA
jgi:uncharacterized membrane protein YfcA